MNFASAMSFPLTAGTIYSKSYITTGPRRTLGNNWVGIEKGNKRLHINNKRVKEWIEEPRNPRSGERQINFQNEPSRLPRGTEIIPGSKGKKRTLTNREKRILKNYGG